MSQTVLLDTGPLGLVTNPRRSAQSLASARWLQALLTSDVRVLVPEIADYELRRELPRANKTEGLRRLDALIDLTVYLPISTAAMRQAARFWSQARQQGMPTATDLALDADVILAAQAVTLDDLREDVRRHGCSYAKSGCRGGQTHVALCDLPCGDLPCGDRAEDGYPMNAEAKR